MATVLWHPDAKRLIIPTARGKPWSGGSEKAKFGFHTTETSVLPNYSSPPHMTLQPGVELWQHIPFDLAAYSVRSSKVDSMKYFYQIEIVGFARFTNGMPDWWYLPIAELIGWFIDNLGVELEFEDFSVMRFGIFAPQRRTFVTVDAFSGVLGHGHVGRGIDSHWDPGKIDVERLEAMLGDRPPPPPPPRKEEDMPLLPLRYGDGYNDGTELTHPLSGDTIITDTRYKRSDVRAVQGMLAEAGATLTLDGRYGQETADSMMEIIPVTAADSEGFVFHGNDWTPLLMASVGSHSSHAPMSHDHPLVGKTGSN